MSLTGSQLALVGWISPARMSCPRPRLLRVASAWRARACARRCSSAAAASRKLVVVEAGTGEVGLLPGRRGCVVFEFLVDEIDHEGGVDDPDRRGEVLAAVVDERVSAVAGAVADLACDADFERSRPGSCGEGVELTVELVRLAAEQPLAICRCPSAARWDSRVVDLFGGVEQSAVVDPDGVGVLVLDDGAVDEGAHVLERLVVQVVAS